MPESRRYILPYIGNMGNAMLQVLIAAALMEHLGEGEMVTNHQRVLDELAPWDLPIRLDTSPPRRGWNIKGPVSNIAAVVAGIAAGDSLDIIVGTCNLHTTQYPPLASARKIFRLKTELDIPGFGADSLVINIRANEVLRGVHRDYVIAPVSFYKFLVATTGLKPVFVGQIADDVYSRAIREAFPSATYLPSVSPIADFETIRRSRFIVTATSTFSLLAAWLSQAEKVFMPVIGGFNPRQRPDGNNVFSMDPRYVFFLFPVFHMKKIEEVFPDLESALSVWYEISAERAAKLSAPAQ